MPAIVFSESVLVYVRLCAITSGTRWPLILATGDSSLKTVIFRCIACGCCVTYWYSFIYFKRVNVFVMLVTVVLALSYLGWVLSSSSLAALIKRLSLLTDSLLAHLSLMCKSRECPPILLFFCQNLLPFLGNNLVKGFTLVFEESAYELICLTSGNVFLTICLTLSVLCILLHSNLVLWIWTLTLWFNVICTFCYFKR